MLHLLGDRKGRHKRIGPQHENMMVTMTMTEMYASVTIVRHQIQNLAMKIKVGVIVKKSDGVKLIQSLPLMTPPLGLYPCFQAVPLSSFLRLRLSSWIAGPLENLFLGLAFINYSSQFQLLSSFLVMFPIPKLKISGYRKIFIMIKADLTPTSISERASLLLPAASFITSPCPKTI